jgi:hypothetical protein
MFPSFVQDVSLQVDLERYPFGYVPRHNEQGPVQAAYPDPFIHRIPTPNQGGPENLRRLAIRCCTTQVHRSVWQAVWSIWKRGLLVELE